MSEGLTLAGRYRLVTKLGQGGMGSVWRAEHLTLGIPVAVKLIDPSIAQSEEALARFRREAQAAAELRSAHVVQIIDYGVENNTPYIAMELLEGESLADRLERVGRLSPAETVALLSQVARALTRAHQQHIIHRDLKPENIYVVREGEDDVVKVLDFGIAKKLGLSSTSSGVKTHTGAMLGTPYYMSPEQAKGHSGVDGRTDIWSLGIIAYECVTGVRPFDRDTLASLLIAICTEPLPVPSQVAPVPVGFDAWFARVACRDLAERFQTANEAILSLREVCGVSGNTQPLEITASSAITTANQLPEVLGLSSTGDPSAVTIGGAKKKRGLRRISLAAGAVAVLAVVGILVGRALSHRDSQNTNASASPNLSSSVAATPSMPPPLALGAASATASKVEGKAAPSVQVAALTQAPENAAKDPAGKGAQPLADRTNVSKGSTRSESSKGSGAAAVAGSGGNGKNSAGKGTTQPPRRDYDKSVGF
jgi:eukaryotic-like serine/threonine-protein kinase